MSSQREPGQRKPSQRKLSPERERTLKRLAIVLGFLFIFAAGEIGLRLYEAYSPYISKTEPYLGDHRYLARTLIPNADYQNGLATLHVNSKGFRGKEFEAAKSAGTCRIFALGGSTTFGHFPDTSSDDKAYPAVLENLLNQSKPDSKPDHGVAHYEVINAGVPGFSVRSSLANFLFRIVYLQPDMVVIYHNTNDLSRYGNEANLLQPLENQFIPRSVSAGLFDHILGWSYLVQEIRFTLVNRFGIGAGKPQAAGGANKPWQLDMRYPDAFRRDLRNLVIVAKANGVTPVLASQSIAFTSKTDFSNLTADERQMKFDKPALFYATVPPEQRYHLFKLYNSIIREVAKEQDVPFADVDAVIPKTPEYHTDYCHLTDRGSALQAETIYKTLQKTACSTQAANTIR